MWNILLQGEIRKKFFKGWSGFGFDARPRPGENMAFVYPALSSNNNKIPRTRSSTIVERIMAAASVNLFNLKITLFEQVNCLNNFNILHYDFWKNKKIYNQDFN